MFDERNAALCKPDAAGAFFFDRNPSCFAAILDAYRGGDIICPPTVAEQTFQQELDFWQIHRQDLPSSPTPSTTSTTLITTTTTTNSPLPPTDLKTLERTLMIMDIAQSMNLTDLTFLVDLDGNVAGIKQSLCVGLAQKTWWTEMGAIVAAGLADPGRVEVFERALAERLGLVGDGEGEGGGRVLVVREVRKTLTLRGRRGVAGGEAELVDPTYLSHWECTLVIP
ncbi:hypothetical protein HDU67_007393 [Dinochytrium kinnereticum]|nr:hypothetical protein HDU67_007393 [Dinochytrium kinnereticum]